MKHLFIVHGFITLAQALNIVKVNKIDLKDVFILESRIDLCKDYFYPDHVFKTYKYSRKDLGPIYKFWKNRDYLSDVKRFCENFIGCVFYTPSFSHTPFRVFYSYLKPSTTFLLEEGSGSYKLKVDQRNFSLSRKILIYLNYRYINDFNSNLYKKYTKYCLNKLCYPAYDNKIVLEEGFSLLDNIRTLNTNANYILATSPVVESRLISLNDFLRGLETAIYTFQLSNTNILLKFHFGQSKEVKDLVTDLLKKNNIHYLQLEKNFIVEKFLLDNPDCRLLHFNTSIVKYVHSHQNLDMYHYI